MIADDLFPGLSDELGALGAVRLNAGRDFAWHFAGGWRMRHDSDLFFLSMSRPLLKLDRQTGPGFSLLREHNYYNVFEGDQIRGSLHTLGSQEVEIVGEITLGVTIEDWGLTLDQATTIFYSRCRQ